MRAYDLSNLTDRGRTTVHMGRRPGAEHPIIRACDVESETRRIPSGADSGSRAVVRSSQVPCGTQTNPLRDAAIRP